LQIIINQHFLDNMIPNEIVYDKVKDIVTSAKEDYLQLVVQDKNEHSSFLYNQRELVRRINFYINNKYIDRDDDAIFWNISTSRIPHFSKLLQFDTKDFLPIGEGEYNFYQSWILRIKSREWFRDEKFYQTLNDLAQGISTYGSIIWKVVQDGKKNVLKECKLENLYFDQSAEDLVNVDMVEKHFLSKNEMIEKMTVWNGVEAILEKEQGNNKIEVWEFTGYLWEEGENNFKHIIGYNYGADYVELWAEDIKPEEYPYELFRLGRYNGRALGIGVVERLFKLQERANELVNQNAESTKIASLLLFKSANTDMTGNVLEQAINGQIVGDDSFEQVGIQNTGLNQFIQELQLINQQADRLCMTPEIIQGEASPASTTFRGLAVVNAAAESAFTIYRQNLGEKISGVLMHWIFPDVIKGWNKGMMVEIAQDDVDVDVYDKAVKNWMAKEKMLNGQELNPQILDNLEAEILGTVKTKGRKIEIPKGWFNFKFGFRLMPTSETGDKSQMNDAYFNALQMTGANPAMTDIPLFRQYLENNGISYWKLTPKQREQLEQANAEGSSEKLPEPKKPDALLASAKPLS